MRSGTVRERVIFTGRVQGVGFRYHASHAARAYGLTGFVRNEYDGSVTMEIQGRPEEIDQVLTALGSDLYIRIENIDRKRIEPVQDERSFYVG